MSRRAKDKDSTPYIRGTPNQPWGKRWVPLNPHPVQLELWNSYARFRVVPAGRRSGKTELAKRRLVVAAMATKEPTGRYFAAAPTRDQAKRIFWNDLKSLVPREWSKAISDSELWIRTSTGSEIWVVGLDKPQRIEGTPWNGCVIDELADVKPGAWAANIRPALADRRGWTWLIGVPDRDAPGQVEYKEMVDQSRSGVDPEWACFSWPSADILPAEEIESARRSMDERTFRQEYLGEFILAGGLAFPDFDSTLHVKPTPYEHSLPICWALDFNVDPMCSGIIQFSPNRGDVRVIDEIVLKETWTDVACSAFLEKATKNNWNLTGLKIYGDASGSAKDSTSGRSDWKIIEERLRNYMSPGCILVPKANPAIKDTINAVNAKIKSADGKVSLSIDPKCTTLIKDLRDSLWPSDLAEQHAIAWLRYFVHRQFPIVSHANYVGNVVFGVNK